MTQTRFLSLALNGDLGGAGNVAPDRIGIVADRAAVRLDGMPAEDTFSVQLGILIRDVRHDALSDGWCCETRQDQGDQFADAFSRHVTTFRIEST